MGVKVQESCGNVKLRILLLVHLGQEREGVFERDPLSRGKGRMWEQDILVVGLKVWE